MAEMTSAYSFPNVGPLAASLRRVGLPPKPPRSSCHALQHLTYRPPRPRLQSGRPAQIPGRRGLPSGSAHSRRGPEGRRRPVCRRRQPGRGRPPRATARHRHGRPLGACPAGPRRSGLHVPRRARGAALRDAQRAQGQEAHRRRRARRRQAPRVQRLYLGLDNVQSPGERCAAPLLLPPAGTIAATFCRRQVPCSYALFSHGMRQAKSRTVDC